MTPGVQQVYNNQVLRPRTATPAAAGRASGCRPGHFGPFMTPGTSPKTFHSLSAGIMSKAPFILLVNPWITDFAAYDLWAKPLGLMLLGALLKEGGCGTTFVDCLDRRDALTNLSPGVLAGVSRRYGTGKYPRMRIPKPSVFSGLPRYYYRHGIHPDSFRQRLTGVPRPDLVWVTSSMTYWYGGVKETIAGIREAFPEVPVWLGGIYAQLCPSHARENSGADEVISCPQGEIPGRIEAATGFKPTNAARWQHFTTASVPDLDWLPRPIAYAPILTSRGCGFRCPYCASGILFNRWERRDSEAVYAEIVDRSDRLGIEDFAFYDDALLFDADTTLKPALQRIAKEGRGLRFHTPNALHARALTPGWCELLRACGFETIRLGLETANPEHQRRWGGKVETPMFDEAVKNLHNAGFGLEQIGVYLLCGMPGQTPGEVAQAIRVVKDAGARPRLAEYSPVPGTPMWAEAKRISPFDLEGEPLTHNNSFFACRRPDFTYENLVELKKMAGN